ncbi:MAG: alpha/beta hydrolase [Acetobacteraceae bacterium]|nr:alpha/beta hydrolase [Acetobacteraceae bacterium]
MRKVAAIVLGVLGVWLTPPANAQLSRQVVELVDGPDGIPRRVLFLLPNRPVGAVLLFPGGSGVVGIGVAGFINRDDNFLIRSRELWRSETYAVALPDVAANVSLLGHRSEAEFADIQAGILARLRVLAGAVPIFLVGTSQGSIGAMNLAARLPPGRIAGLVLTSTVTRASGAGETVFDAHPEQVLVPTLIVNHDADTCRIAPPGDAAKIVAALTGAPRKDILAISAQSPLRDGPCSPFGPHGFLNIEGSTVRRITAWMRQISP